MATAFATVTFDKHLAEGWIAKAGKAAFFDGKRRFERVLWWDWHEGKYYVKLNGNAYAFTPYSEQGEAGIIIGHI